MKDKDLCKGCFIVDSLCPGLDKCDRWQEKFEELDQKYGLTREHPQL
jgi:hypothetical protein